MSKAATLVQYINRNNTAVVVLQETLLSDATILRFGHYQLFQLPYRQGGPRGLITLVRKDIPATLIVNPPHLGDQVDLLSVTLHFDNTNVDVHNVYCRQRSRLNLMSVLERHHGRPTLLTGDFNAHHPVLEPWQNDVTNQRGHHIVHMLEEFDSMTLHGEPQATHIAGGRLDLALSVNADNRGLDITSESVTELLSDHWAQIIQFKVIKQMVNERPERKKWITKKANWMLFTAHITDWFNKYRVPDTVQAFSDDLTQAIQDAADASIPRYGRKKYNRGRKRLWYYDDRVKLLNKVTRQLTAAYKRSRDEADRTTLLEWLPYAREQMNLIREEKYLQFTSQLNHTSSMTQVWDRIKRIRGQHSRPSAHPDPAGKAEELMRDYHERSSSDSLPDQLREKKDAMDPARLTSIMTATEQQDDTDQRITREELLAARKPSSDTAPGDDGITYSMLDAVCQVEGDPLLQLFNMSLMQGELPRAWTTANIVPIPKPGQNDKYRPISLTSTMCKTLERILLNRLLYKIGRLDVGVNGFIRHRSTANCLANYFANDKAKTTVFLDIEKAFDRAQPLVILEELIKLGVKGKLLTWIQRYLTGRTARVIFQGHASGCKLLENGTPQGGVLSPMLFNVLMNVLAQLNYPAGTQHIGYADDVVLQTSGENSTRNMQQALDALTAKCEEIGFTVSHTKTKAMAKTRSIPPTKLHLQGRDIDWVATHKYLGVIVARNNTCKAEIQHLKAKCRLRNRILKALSWKGMGASSFVILSSYKALVRSLIDYASPALINITASDAKTLETIQNEALRTVCGAPKWTKTDNLRAVTQVPTLTDRINYVTVNFLIRTCVHDDHQDHVYTALLRHHEGRGRGQGKWINKAAALMNDYTVTWQDMRDATVPPHTQMSPPWEKPPITTTVVPLPRKKKDSIQAEARQQGLQSIHEAMNGNAAAVYYTDGSVDEQGRAGAAFVCALRDRNENHATAAADAAGDNTITTAARSARITDHSSSTQAELAAIKLAIDHAHTCHNLDILINCDSMTAITSLCKGNNENIGLTHSITTTAKAIHHVGRTVSVNWVPSHVGISGNEKADLLAKQAAQRSSVDLVIPRTQQQLREKARRHLNGRRLQRQREEARGGNSVSARWLDEVADENTPPLRRAESRRCEVVRARICLGYPYAWQLGMATPDRKRQCRLCDVDDGHTLEHYLRDCERVTSLRQKCSEPNPTLVTLAKHFLKILPQTLSEHPKFCDIA